MALPERFSHLLACLRVRSVLFSRHRHIGLFYSGPRFDATLEEAYRASAKWAAFTGPNPNAGEFRRTLALLRTARLRNWELKSFTSFNTC